MSREQAASRRQFIATTASAVAAATIVPRHVLGGQRFVAPSDKVNVAIIGAGGQGRTNARALFQEEDCQIIAIADPAEEWDLSAFYYGGKAGRGPVKAEIEEHYAGKTPNYRCTAYEDFRVMLEKEKAIDAVLIATPDHLHAYVSILAMKAGKHVYCEKPLTHNIEEARLVARVAKETGVATQMGNHGRSGEGHRQTVEWITGRRDRRRARGARLERRPPDPARAPGRARVRPPRPPVSTGTSGSARGPHGPTAAYAPFVWRACGTSATAPARHGVHHLDPAFNALGLDTPVTVEATASDVDPEICPRGMLVTYHFAAQGNRGPLTVYLVRRRAAAADAARDRPRRPAAAARRGRQRPPLRRREGNPHLRRMVRACRACSRSSCTARTSARRRRCRASRATTPTGSRPARAARRPCSNFDYGARLTELTLLGNVALRTGKVLKWDAANMKATNAPERGPVPERHLPRGLGAPGLTRPLHVLPRHPSTPGSRLRPGPHHCDGPRRSGPGPHARATPCVCGNPRVPRPDGGNPRPPAWPP